MARTKRRGAPIPPATLQEARSQRIYRAGGYVRLSAEDGGRPGGDTMETQRELISGYIDRQPDLELGGIFCDNGQSGTNFARPAFERLMAEVRAGKIDCIVVKDLSRFGRNYKETGSYLERIFPLLGVRFVAINDHFDTLAAKWGDDGYIVPLKNIINEVYSKDISRKVRSALAVKRQSGAFTGSWAAYGYRKCAGDHHRIEPDGETAQIVRDIFRQRLAGVSCRQIARTLNAGEIPSPGRRLYLSGAVHSERYANALWTAQTIKGILENEVYLGHMAQGRRRSGPCGSWRQEKVPKSEWTVVHNTHEPIVSEDTFRAVQELAEAARSTYRARLGCRDNSEAAPNILKGLVFCADCKRPLVRYKSGGSHGKNLCYVFICPSHSSNPASCPKKYCHEAQLKELIWDILRREIALSGDFEELVRKISRAPENAAGEAGREIAALRQAHGRARMLFESLYANYRENRIDAQEYMELKQQYRADIKRAEAQIEALERRQAENRPEPPRPAACGASRPELTEELAHALLERVEIDGKNHISIALRCRDMYQALLRSLEAAGAEDL